MSEALALLGSSLAILAGLTALGSGPALALGDRAPSRLLLAPIAGLALAGVLLSGASALLPMRVAAFAVLLLATIASATWAGLALRRDRPPAAPGTAAALALVAVALALALLPGLLRGTRGPIGLNVYDAWTYVPASRWLADNTAYDELPREALRSDLTLADGWILTRCGCRVGVISLGSASAELLGADPLDVHLALLAVLFALIPAAIWLTARELGLEPGYAALAAAFGLSPAVLLLVGDSVLGNLGGLVLAPPALALGARAALAGGRRQLALAALLFAGLVSIYPEFVLPALAVAALGVVSLAAPGRGRAQNGAPTRKVALRGGAIVLGGAVLAPVAVERAHHYVTTFFEEFSEGIPRYLGVDDIGSWLFGVQHLYELQRFGELGVLKTTVAVALPLALAALALLGALRSGWRGGLFVAAPVLVSAALGLYVYAHYDECQYCLWKALTFTLPFLAIGIALGLRALRPRGGGMALAATAVVVLGLLAIARSDVDLTRAAYNSAAITSGEERGLGDSLAQLPDGARVLLEGAEATAAGAWGPEELYYLARNVEPRNLPGGAPALRLLFDPRPQTLLPVNPRARFYYSPDYEFVISVFAGVRGREVLARDGTYTLARRAPIDVAITATGWALDPGAGAAATPWLQGPFQLWVSSPRRQRAALRLRFAGPWLARTGLRFRSGGRPLTPAAGAAPGSPSACLDLRLRRGRTVVSVMPRFGPAAAPTFPVQPASGIAISSQADPRLRATEADPLPPPPRLLTLRAARALPGGCAGEEG